MALAKQKSEIPKDAILLTENEALEFQFDIISNWDIKKDVRIFTYGPGCLGGISAITGIAVNSYYRNRLRLSNYGFVSTYFPIVILPAVMSTLLHRVLIQPRILLHKDECLLCLQTKSMALQCGIGVIYPTLLAPLASFMFATRHYTYRLPSITKNPMDMFRLYRKMTQPIMAGLSIGLGVHAILASYIVYKETESFWTIENKLRKIESEFDENSSTQISTHAYN